MSKRKFARIAAVFTTLAATMALIGVAVIGTGAYFTDSTPGAITGNLGTVVVAVSGQDINFANLMPGETQTQTVTVRNDGTGNEDIYLAFKNDNFAWSAVNDMGQYGKFVIAGNTYDNLNNRYAQGTPGSGVMSTNPASGCYNVPRVAINYLPHVISIFTLTPGQTSTFNVSFTVNPCMTGGQGSTLWGTAPGDFSPPIAAAPLQYVVAAFQPGVNPNDQMNGAGKIAPLGLPLATDSYSPPATFQ